METVKEAGDIEKSSEKNEESQDEEKEKHEGSSSPVHGFATPAKMDDSLIVRAKMCQDFGLGQVSFIIDGIKYFCLSYIHIFQENSEEDTEGDESFMSADGEGEGQAEEAPEDMKWEEMDSEEGVDMDPVAGPKIEKAGENVEDVEELTAVPEGAAEEPMREGEAETELSIGTVASSAKNETSKEIELNIMEASEVSSSGGNGTDEEVLNTVDEEKEGDEEEEKEEEESEESQTSSPKKVLFSDQLEVSDKKVKSSEEKKEGEECFEEPVDGGGVMDDGGEKSEIAEDQTGGAIGGSKSEEEVMDTEADKESQEAQFEDSNEKKVEAVVKEKIENVSEKALEAKREALREKDLGVSPPLKLKIKFGKDKTGAITHGKIKNKLSPSSGEERDNTPNTASKRSTKATYPADDIPLPEDPDEPFHGFPISAIDLEHKARDFEGWDLTTPFRIRPTVYVSISSKKTAKGGTGTPATPSSALKQPGTAIEDSAVKDNQVRSDQKLVTEVPADQSKLAAALRGEVTKTGTPKVNYKQINFTRPLYEGWVRELVWRNEEKKEGEVFYYTPQTVNEPRNKIKNDGELEAYLITSGSLFPTNFFSFKKEALGGPEGGEIIRNIDDPPIDLESKSQESNQASLVPGKRVRKPPEKLAEQPAESPSTLTPSRISKRVSRPPGKYSDDEPPAKAARVETGERRPSANSKEAGALSAKESVRDWTQAVKEDTMLKTKTGSPAMKQLQSLPGLKLKTFSKMSADSRNQVLEKTGSTVTGSDSDIIMVEGEPETAPAPSMPPLAMSITKVKKPAMPSLPRGTLITLPGAPTTGPPPPARSHPTATPPARQPIVQQPNIHNPGGVSITSLGAAPMRNPRMGGPSPPSLSRSPATPQLKNLNDVDFLRPTKQTQLPCSIHCLGVTGIPSLSCTACHCLYHPKCVGLGGLPQSLFNSKPFYCNDCTPPPDNIGPVSAPKYGKGSAAPIPATAQTNLKQSPALSTPHRQQQPMSSSQANKVAESQKPPKSVKKSSPPPPAPFQGQQMINIAGRKFLLTPHPTPAPTLESPPPSPPQLSLRGSGSVNKEQQNNSNRGGAGVQQNLQRQATERLSVLLRPVDGGDVPSFEVEETPDGKFLLVPFQEGGNAQRPPNWGGRSEKTGEEDVIKVKSWGSNFTNNLSGGYHAMMQVFRYLSVRERLQASSVCKLWRDIALHQSLWHTVSLKNTRVYNWEGFGEFLRQTKATQLDLRKMLFVKERDVTWSEIVGIASNFAGLRKLELPKLEGSVLAALATACPRLESLQAPLVTPPLDLQKLVSVPGLKELKLKASAGSSLKVVAGMRTLEGLAPSLTHLSLLTLDGLTEPDFDVFGTLVRLNYKLMINNHNSSQVHLQTLELGDCHNAPYSLFKTLSDLTRLQRLRLERGAAAENVGKLANAPRLQQLELVDFNIGVGFKAGLKMAKNIKKLLIIPTYQV